MADINVIVLRTAGTNCDRETCHAFELAGARPQTIHVNRLIDNPAALHNAQILALPGGFSYGDDIAAGRILANQLIHHVHHALHEFIAADKLVLGICNGFQVLVKAGLLPNLDPDPHDASPDRQQATITHNDSGRFEDRWVNLQPCTDKCVFIDPDRPLYLPVAHGEGKVMFADDKLLCRAQDENQIAFRYVDDNLQPGPYPVNPNGSIDHIAGLCDPTGRVLGLMPHPERFVHRTHHPRWTRLDNQDDIEPDGLTIFRRALQYFA